MSRLRGKKRYNPEELGQIEIVKFLARCERLGLLVYFHCPNELLRTSILRIIFSKLGCRAGVSDLIICARGKVLFIELKMLKGVMSAAQKQWRDALIEHGFTPYTVKMADPKDGARKVRQILCDNGVDCMGVGI